MTAKIRVWYRQIRSLKWLSPGSFVLCAIVFAAVFAGTHLAGWRSRTSVLCGTLPDGRNAQIVHSFEAVAYTFFYLTTVVVSPILVIAAGIFYGISPKQRLIERNTPH